MDNINLIKSYNYTYLERDGYNYKIQCNKCNTITSVQISNFKKSPKCYKCECDNKIQFIKLRGYTHIQGYSLNMVIKCNKCGANKTTDWKHFYNEGFDKCGNCELNERQLLIESKGYSIIKRAGNKYTIKCNKCNKVSTVRYSDLENNVCQGCILGNKLKYIKEHNYTYISHKGSKFLLKCNKCGKIKDTYWQNFFNKQATKCSDCELIHRKEFINSKNFKYISGFSTDLNIKCCNCNYTWVTKWSHFERCHLCPNCGTKRSSFELDVEKYLPNPQINVFGVIPGLELDFYLPDYNLAVECNGDYWHSIEFKDSTYHLNKYNLCKEKGIRLIQIPELEWYNNKEWFISLIKCYIENGDFSQFSKNGKYDRMFISELVVEGETTAPEIVSGKYEYYNCGYIKE